MSDSDQREDLAEAGRTMSRLGLVTAYGHVSLRTGPAMLITPGADLGGITGSDIVEVDLAASTLPVGAPAEAWAHLAVYRARPDARSVARAQPAATLAAAATTSRIPALYGQAAWLGESVPVHDSARLLRSAALGDQAAADLAVGDALLLRGNGALTLGASPGLAVTRMWLLDALCTAWLSVRGAGQIYPMNADEIASWRAVGEELLPRLWRHLRDTTRPAPRPEG